MHSDDLVTTIEGIHAAGLDAERWSDALTKMARIFGAPGATFEVFDKPQWRPSEYHFVGVPQAAELDYLDQYLPLSPRIKWVMRSQAAPVSWDYQMLDEAALRQDIFYEEFLPRLGFRYFLAATLCNTPQHFAIVAVQRSPAQGHVEREGIATMQLMLPHLQQAFDVARRLKGGDDVRRSLEHALDWLADGVALVRADGAVIYANEALRSIVRRGDAIAIRKGRMAFSASEAKTLLERALAGAARLRRGEVRTAVTSDFPVKRSTGAPAYLVSVRPLPDQPDGRAAGAIAMVFVRDPLRRDAAAVQILRDVFGLTDAEANLATALQAGMSLNDYAQSHAVSLNTVYTHLRRIKEKTGCKRLSELIHKLNDMRVPLRAK
jgi:DNA-binding CsgD family transcriptional regulator